MIEFIMRVMMIISFLVLPTMGLSNRPKIQVAELIEKQCSAQVVFNVIFDRWFGYCNLENSCSKKRDRQKTKRMNVN